jgi:DNA-binding transcriptional regulator GbsR (MarR family)
MLNDEEKQFIEKVGLAFEQLTFPRMAGRVIGFLLISEQPTVSMMEVVEALQASKSSISSTARLLIQVGLIERVSQPGDRRDYYRIHPLAWVRSLQDRLTQAHDFRQLAEEGLNLLPAHGKARRLRLEEMRGIYRLLEVEIPGLIERWEEERKTLLKKI